ncbi:hypothetical protein FOYG_14937 [Fusarium oxysporum NRRL 32931]|uniref:Uncharacterized protein n=1 Tax=Fusarium oxysporum NRRL 32931 TaxID=660029 RepID=W9HPR3_FUSOX|nr:hypothetical protein FOYG_14937 [Fusarium oxysporum NRRL 32931]
MAKDLPLHFDRVFISANSLNLQVFNGIANHQVYRHQVTEIVWDDARLSSGPEREEERRDFHYLGSDPDFAEGANGCPRWFKAGSNISDDPPCHPSCHTTASDHMGLQECWAYYRALLEDQRQVLASNTDIESFKFGLQLFTRLKRVTITPATHG